MLATTRSLVAVVALLLGGCQAAAPTLRLYGSRPDTGGWPVGPAMTWGGEQAIADIRASGLVSFDIEIQWHDDSCARQAGMKSLIGSLSNSSGGAVHGVLGSGCSSVCGGLAELSPLWGLPVLSWGCSSPSLSDSALYPYFSRTSISGAFHCMGWVLLMRYIGWRRFASIYEREEGAYHQASQNELARWMAVETPGIELAVVRFVKLGGAALEGARRAAREVAAAGVRVVAANGYAGAAAVILCGFLREGLVGPNWVFMSLGWLADGWVARSAADSGCTAAELLPVATHILGTTDLTWSLDNSLTTVSGKTPQALKGEYYAHMAANQSAVTPSDFAALVYDATWAFALAMEAFLAENPNFLATFDHTAASDSSPSMAGIHSKIIAQDFIGATGRVWFDSHGDRKGGIEVRQLLNDSTWRLKGACSLDSCLFVEPVDFGLGQPWDPQEPSVLEGRVPGDAPPACSSGLSLNLQRNICEECPVGKVFMQQVGGCVCRAGYNISRADPDACAPCPPGTFAGATGIAGACSPCPAGSHAPGNASTECARCPQGKFQSQEAATECTACGAGENTLVLAADSASECRCRAGFFRQDNQSSCRPCPDGMACAFGSDMANYRRWLGAGSGRGAASGAGAGSGDGSGAFPELLPSHMSLRSDPLSVFRCRSEARCPGGPPGACGPELDAGVRACARCRDGWYWDGEQCTECTAFEASSALFPIIPLVLSPVAISGLYYSFRDEVGKWGSWRNGLAAVAFVLLNHYQITSLVGTADIERPQAVAQVFGFWSFAEDPLAMFKPECVGFAGLTEKTVLRSLSLVAVFLLFAATFGGSHAAQRFTGKGVAFDIDKVTNIFFSLVFTFFAGISSMALTIFKCTGNPNGLDTLATDQSVICGQGEWSSLVVVAVLAVLLYIFGFGALFLRAILVAPSRFGSVRFQRRWKFLFIKFRPDVWWWAMAFCAKGFLMNIGFTFLNLGIQQTYWVMTVTALYCGLAIAYMPWRHRLLNGLDIYMHFALMFVCSLLAFYVHGATEELAAVGRAIATVILVVNFSPCVLCLCAAPYLVWSQAHPASQARRAAEIQELSPALRQFARAEPAEQQEFLEGLDEWGRHFLMSSMRILGTEFAGQLAAKRISSGALKSKSSGSEEVSEGGIRRVTV